MACSTTCIQRKHGSSQHKRSRLRPMGSPVGSPHGAPRTVLCIGQYILIDSQELAKSQKSSSVGLHASETDCTAYIPYGRRCCLRPGLASNHAALYGLPYR